MQSPGKRWQNWRVQPASLPIRSGPREPLLLYAVKEQLDPESWRVGDHVHAHHEVLLFQKGHQCTRISGHEEVAGPGEVFFFRKPESVRVMIGDIPVFEAQVARTGAAKAIRIERPITQATGADVDFERAGVVPDAAWKRAEGRLQSRACTSVMK